MLSQDTRVRDICTTILMYLKISPGSLGFDYMRQAIILCYHDKSLIQFVTKKLYPQVGEYFHVKANIVERSIRTAINKAYECGGLLGLNDFYNVIVYTNKFKYTNSELISIIVEKIRIDIMKEEFYSDPKNNDEED